MNKACVSKRAKVAREAATLLYFRQEKEYKQAKIKAAESFGCHALPTNLEVALELDIIAEEDEGPARAERLCEMRRQALKVMKILKAYYPVLIGSVWRGNIRRGSDIDIAAYSNEPDEVVTLLEANGVKILHTEPMAVIKHGKTEASFHINLEISAKQNVEIAVRNVEELGRKRACEIFGDEIKGLKTRDLEKLLKDDPYKRFVPS